MTEQELFKKWNELTALYTDKETKLEAYVQKWLDGDSSLSSESLEALIDSTNEQVQQLKSMADNAIQECVRLGKEEKLREVGLQTAKRVVKEQFGTSPDEIIITGGVLSSNSSESHMIGREKTQEELEQERQYALSEIRSRVASKQISLAEASKLKGDVNIAYGFTTQEQNISNGIRR